MKKKTNADKYFLLTWKRFVISALIFIIVFFFRYIIRPIFEPLGMYDIIFYVFSIGIPVYLLFTFIYTIIIKKIKSKKLKKANLFLLTWKKTGIMLISWIVAVVIHNMIYAFSLGVLGIEFEEAVFFLIANVVIPIYFIICVLYSLIKRFKLK